MGKYQKLESHMEFNRRYQGSRSRGRNIEMQKGGRNGSQ